MRFSMMLIWAEVRAKSRQCTIISIPNIVMLRGNAKILSQYDAQNVWRYRYSTSCCATCICLLEASCTTPKNN
jgi:hypothetical protein